MRTEPSFSTVSDHRLSDDVDHLGDVSGSHIDTDSQILSDYRQRYGLSIDPFVDDPHFPFYTGAQRRQLLEQLLHLCQFSHNLLVVAGEYGVGKTRMAQALIDGLDDADDICFVEGQINSDVASLLAEIYEQFDLSSSAEFSEFCRKKTEQDGLVVLIVDNAHHLSSDVVLDLINLLQENTGSRLHLVLFAEPHFLSRLERVEAPDLVLTDFLLEKFSLNEAVDYLNFRMEMADYLGPEVFVDAKVEPWWRQSQGQLLQLHEHAQEKLLASVSKPQRSRGDSSAKRGLPIPHIVAASGLVGALILGSLYWGSSTEKPVSNLAQPIPAPVQPPSIATSSQVVSSPTSSASAVNPVAITEYKSVEPVHHSATSTPTVVESTLEKPTVVKQSVVPLVQTNELQANAEQQIKVKNTSSAKASAKIGSSGEQSKSIPSLKSEAVSVPEPKVSQDFSDQEKTILGWGASEYTLQLMGLSSEKAAREFLAAQPNKKDLLLFRSKRQGKDWFVVVTGHFPSSAKARQAGQSLSESQKKASPWPREVKIIQQEIRQR